MASINRKLNEKFIMQETKKYHYQNHQEEYKTTQDKTSKNQNNAVGCCSMYVSYLISMGCIACLAVCLVCLSRLLQNTDGLLSFFSTEGGKREREEPIVYVYIPFYFLFSFSFLDSIESHSLRPGFHSFNHFIHESTTDSPRCSQSHPPPRRSALSRRPRRQWRRCPRRGPRSRCCPSSGPARCR